MHCECDPSMLINPVTVRNTETLKVKQFITCIHVSSSVTLIVFLFLFFAGSSIEGSQVEVVLAKPVDKNDMRLAKARGFQVHPCYCILFSFAILILSKKVFC